MRASIVHSSIRTRLLVAFALVSIGPALVITLTSALSAYRIAQVRSFEQLDSVVALRTSEIHEWMRDLQVDLDALITERGQTELVEPLIEGRGDSGARKGLKDGLISRFRASMAQTAIFSDILLLDGNGRVLVSTNPSLEGMDEGMASYFRQGLQRNFLTPPYRDPERRGSGVIIASHPIVAKGRGSIGVLAGISDMKVLDRIMAEPTGLGSSGENYLVGSDYRPLTGLRGPLRTQDVLPQKGGLALALRSKLGGHGASDDYRGVGVLESYAWLPDLQVALVVQQDRAEIFGSIMAFLIVDLIIAFVALLITAVASLLLAGSIARPVGELAAAAEKMAGGDLDQVVDIPGVDEVGHLAAVFNTMAARLRSVVGQQRAELAERRRAEERLRHAHERSLQYFESAAVLMVVLDREGRVVQLNRRGHDILEYEEGELEGRDWFASCLSDGSRNQVRDFFAATVSGLSPAVEAYENPVVTKSGKERIVRWHNSYLKAPDGTISGILSSGEDVTERRRAEEAIERSLAEKEALLRELHHRTNNNMGVIIGLLDLQAEEARDATLRTAFTEMQDRIRAMALVHQKLYQSGDLSRINLREYVADLARHMIASYRVNQGEIAVSSEMEEVFVLIDTAIPCGLILNELISNALKHAFPGSASGSLRLGLGRRADGRIWLEVADEGVGPPSGFDPRRDGHMGMQTVFALGEEQLKGSVEFEMSSGFACRVLFRDDFVRARI